MYNPYAIGQHLYLRALREEDAAGRWHEWFSDEDVTRFLEARVYPNTLEAQQAFYRSVVSGPGNLVLAVVDRATDRHIGVASLRAISAVHRHADIAVVIGEKEFWGKAVYGLEAHTLMLRIAFQRLNLENLRAGYAAKHEATAVLLKLLRFTEVGRYKDLLFLDGEKQDLVMAQLSRADWLVRNGGGRSQ